MDAEGVMKVGARRLPRQRTWRTLGAVPATRRGCLLPACQPHACGSCPSSQKPCVACRCCALLTTALYSPGAQSSKPVDEKLVERRKEGVHPGKVGGCWIVAARPVDRFSWWRGDREGVHLGKVRGWAWLL